MSDIREKRVELILQQLDDLPTLPAVAVRVLETTSNDTSDAHQVVQLIESDPSLTARILQLVHRSDVGVRGEVASVERAVVLLGFEAVRSAVLAIAVFETFRESGKPLASQFRRDEFWKHCVGVACCRRVDRADAQGQIDRPLRSLRLRPAARSGQGRAGCRVSQELQSCGRSRRTASGKYRRCRAHGDRPGSHGRRQAPGRAMAIARERARLHLAARTGPQRPAAERAQSAHGQSHHAGRPDRSRAASWLQRELRFPSFATTSRRRDRPVTRSDRRDCSQARRAHRAARHGAGAESNPHRRALSVGAGTSQPRAGPRERTTRVKESPPARSRKILRCAESISRRASPGCAAAGRASRDRPNRGRGARCRGFAVFSLPPGREYAETTLVDRKGEVFETSLVDIAKPPSRQDGSARHGRFIQSDRRRPGTLGWRRNWNGFSAPISPRLSGDHRFWICLEADGVPIGGVVWGAKQGESQRLSPQAQELLALSSGWSLALRTTQIREEARALSEQLAEANRRLQTAQDEIFRSKTMITVGEMAAGAAHEMNNPLAVISGRSQLLAAQLTDPSKRPPPSSSTNNPSASATSLLS